jgi:NAD(P)-dependent dehydrogenase (short-subunit alcohol dehydrogenase family)
LPCRIRAAYAAGKFALTGLSETVRAELAKSGVAVTTVTPGLMRTGSYVNVRLRGDHAAGFRWFAAMSATPLTSQRARRARAAQVIAAAAPNAFAALAAAVDRRLLPGATADREADRPCSAQHVDPGMVKALLGEDTRRQFHQPEPAWR